MTQDERNLAQWFAVILVVLGIIIFTLYSTSCGSSKQVSLLKLEHQQTEIVQKENDLRAQYQAEQAKVQALQGRYPDATKMVNDANAEFKRISDDLQKKLKDFYAEHGTSVEQVTKDMEPSQQKMADLQKQYDALEKERAALAEKFERERKAACGAGEFDIDSGTCKKTEIKK